MIHSNKSKQNDGFAAEVRTSMSPRSNEITISLKSINVFSVLHGFAMSTKIKKVGILHERCSHRCHHAAARDLPLKIFLRCMVRFV